MPRFNSCLRSTDLSIVSTKKSSSHSLKSLFRRHLFKKSTNRTRSIRPIVETSTIHDTRSTLKQRQIIDASHNYDMTVFHDEDLDDTQLALYHRRSKRIPRWAQRNQLQMAIIDQIYYNDQNPDEIFGRIPIDSAVEMVKSIELWNSELSFFSSVSSSPENFV